MTVAISWNATNLFATQMLLRDFILTFRKKTTRFYYHTDQHSVHAVIAELEVLSFIAWVYSVSGSFVKPKLA
jgi:hypothetical protein